MPKVSMIVSVDGTMIGGQQNATLNRSTNMIDTSSKGSDFESVTPGLKNWSVDADGFVIEDDAAFQTLEQAWLNGTAIQIEMKSEANVTQPTSYSGEVYIESFPIESSYSETAKYNLTFKGSGALTMLAYDEAVV